MAVPVLSEQDPYKALQETYNAVMGEIRGKLEDRTTRVAGTQLDYMKASLNVCSLMMKFEGDLSGRVEECKVQGGRIEEIAKILRPNDLAGQNQFIQNDQNRAGNMCLDRSVLFPLLQQRA